MKKLAFILITMLLLVFVAGCSKQQPPAQQQTNTETLPTDNGTGNIIEDVPNVTDIGDNPDTGSLDNISVDTAMQ